MFSGGKYILSQSRLPWGSVHHGQWISVFVIFKVTADFRRVFIENNIPALVVLRIEIFPLFQFPVCKFRDLCLGMKHKGPVSPGRNNSWLCLLGVQPSQSESSATRMPGQFVPYVSLMINTACDSKTEGILRNMKVFAGNSLKAGLYLLLFPDVPCLMLFSTSSKLDSWVVLHLCRCW